MDVLLKSGVNKTMSHAKCFLHGALSLGLALAWSLSAAAPTKVDVAMVLWRGMTEADKGFQARLQEAKQYQFNFKIYDADQNMEKLGRIVAEIESGHHALIYSFGTTATNKLKERIRNRPIVFNAVARPVEAKLIASWEHSGNNVTGASNEVPMASVLNTLSKVMVIKRLGVIYNPKEANSVIQRNELEQLGPKFGHEIVDGAVKDPQDFGQVVASLVAAKVDAVLLPSDSLITANADKIIPLLNQHRIPSIASIPSMVRDRHAFIGIGPDYFEMGRMAGSKALAILEGAKPTDVPSTTLNRVQITVNLATAKAIRVAVPVQVLRIATVIQ